MQVDPEAGPDVALHTVDPESEPSQLASQYPQYPEMWSLLGSVFVEHQGLESPSMVVHFEWETPAKLKGKTQAEPDAGPLTVTQRDLFRFTWLVVFICLLSAWIVFCLLELKLRCLLNAICPVSVQHVRKRKVRKLEYTSIA